MNDEKKMLLNEWFECARDGLESAKELLDRATNYHISLINNRFHQDFLRDVLTFCKINSFIFDESS